MRWWVALMVSGACFAATSTTWQMSGFSDFSKGKLTGLSLTWDGLLRPGPGVRVRAALNAPAVWSVATADNGAFYVSTGNSGRVLRVERDGTVKTVWTAPQPEVFAVCTTADHSLWAATSPNGGVYQIQNGEAKQRWRSTEKYIWSLECASDGSVYAGTGERGRVYRITGTGAELYFETGQTNVTALASSAGHVYAGTDPNGLLFDITSARTATVLYNSSLPEIRSIAVAGNGTLYVAAMGGAVSTRTGTPASAMAAGGSSVVTAANTTVITVTEAAETSSTPQPSSTSVASTPATGSTTSVSEVSGVDKSAIYKISANHAVETLRVSKEENVYDLALDGNAVVFSTDVRGRIYRLDDSRTTLLSEIGDGVATRIRKSGDELFVTLSNPGNAYFLSGAQASAVTFESPVHDVGSAVAKWGHLEWHGSGTGIVTETRSGFSARPDATWSAWKPVASDSLLIQSPAARYIQARLRWSNVNAVVDSLAIPYLPQNNRPAIHSISVGSVMGTNAGKTTASSSAASSPYSITVTESGEAPAATTSSTANQTVSHLQSGQTQISWQADDPDGDKLAYSLYFRAEDETQWQLIRARIFENSILLDPDVFADGRYFFRVVASDAPSNAPEYAQQAELVSPPVLIDNTPPVVTITNAKRQDAVAEIDLHAVDATSPLRVCEYSLDAGNWQPIESTDGVTDSPSENFHVHLEKLRPGEHLIVFRVYDAVNNAGLAKAVLR